MYETNVMINFIVSFCTGVLSGFGIGGGTLLIIYLVFFAGVDQKTAQSVNLLYFLPTAVGSMIPHVKNRRINGKVLIPTAVSGIAFAILAANLVKHVNVSLLRQVFGVFLVYIGFRETFSKK